MVTASFPAAVSGDNVCQEKSKTVTRINVKRRSQTRWRDLGLSLCLACLLDLMFIACLFNRGPATHVLVRIPGDFVYHVEAWHGFCFNFGDSSLGLFLGERV